MNIEPIKFKFKGRTLEVRAFRGAVAVRVAVFEGDRQVIPLTYSVSYEDAADARMQKFSTDLIQSLMETAQDDVQKGIVNLI